MDATTSTPVTAIDGPRESRDARASERVFDGLARTLAEPVSRRRALRLLGGFVAAAAIPGLKPSFGAAGTAGVAHPDIIDPDVGPWGEPVPCGETTFGPVICNPASNCVKCCHVDGKPASCCPCYFTCRPSGLCGDQFACPPDGRPYCGGPGKCCNTNEFCFKGLECVPICKSGEQLCDDQCCPRGFECVQVRLPGLKPRLECLQKCPSGRTRCGVFCCPRGQKCVNPGLSPTRQNCSRCNLGEKPCGRKCCARGSTCCDPRTGLCCRRNETCAGFAGQAKCCPRGTRACKTDPATGRPLCCGQGEVCAEQGDETGTVPLARRNRYTCCPPDRTVPFSGGANVCCPPGYRSLGGRLLVPPGGGGGFCCRADKLCGSTCCGTNADPGIDATCCNGTCVSLYFDPLNCGACGRACPPGQRCVGGICVT